MHEEISGLEPMKVASFLLSRGHPGWLGLAYRDHGEDWAELDLPWREDLLGEPAGVMASGPIVSLLDMASGMAVWFAMSEFRAIATLDLRVDYMRPARHGATVTGRAQCYRRTRSAAFVRGYAHDGDPEDPVAHMAGCFMTVPWRSR